MKCDDFTLIISHRPTITWRREDGEDIRLCAPNYGEEDNCSQVKEYVGDSLTLININRSVMSDTVTSQALETINNSSASHWHK